MKTYDYIVIGSGPGGSSVAHGLANDGKQVAIVDPLFGGTCALKGCTPKKAMESVTSAYWAAKSFENKGFPKLNDFVDWHDLMSHKSKFTTLVPSGTKVKFKKAGIEIFEAKAKFKDNHTIKVGSNTIKAENIIIACGSTPRKLSFEGGEMAVSSYEFFELDQLPKRIVIIGGGFIAFELSHIAAACGSKVTIISMEDLPFSSFDEDIVKQLIQATLHKGIDVRLGYKATNIEQSGDHFKVKTMRMGSDNFTFSGDLVINASGRVPNTADLSLVNTDLQINDNGAILTDDFLVAKGCDHIYAIGDVIGNNPFTEAANYEADLLLYNFRNKRRKRVDYSGMPVVVYTYPKMAMVGKCAQDLKKDNIVFKVNEARLSNFFTQRTKANNFARYRTCIQSENGQILSAHLIGCGIDEIINLFGMAIQCGISVDQMKNLLLAYPTTTHDIKYLFGN